MRALKVALAGVALVATTALAQNPPRRGMGMQMADHWMTWDSLTTALSLKGDQATKVGNHYEMLNAVIKVAAEDRAKMREMFQGGGGGAPSEDARAQMATMRTKLDSLQTEVDKHYTEMRNLLTPAQQAKFDELEKPMVAMRRRPGN